MTLPGFLWDKGTIRWRLVIWAIQGESLWGATPGKERAVGRHHRPRRVVAKGVTATETGETLGVPVVGSVPVGVKVIVDVRKS